MDWNDTIVSNGTNKFSFLQKGGVAIFNSFVDFNGLSTTLGIGAKKSWKHTRNDLLQQSKWLLGGILEGSNRPKTLFGLEFFIYQWKK